MARLTGNDLGASNTILLDVQGTPSFDLPDTNEYEGKEIDAIKLQVEDSLTATQLDARQRDRGQNEQVEIMRQDPSVETHGYTIHRYDCRNRGITITESTKVSPESSQGNYPVLRTLGVNRKSLLTGYLYAPIIIGSLGCFVGCLIGPWGMNGMLDFYQSIVGVPIIERQMPTAYTGGHNTNNDCRIHMGFSLLSRLVG